MSIKGLPIEFQGERYLLVGDLTNGGSIATREQCRKMLPSFAYLGADGAIRRNREIIGNVSDIEILRK